MLRCFLLTSQHVNTYKCLILKLTRLMLLMFWLKRAIYICYVLNQISGFTSYGLFCVYVYEFVQWYANVFFFFLFGCVVIAQLCFFILLLLYILHISFTYCLRCAATVLWQRSDSFHSLLVRVTQKDKEPRIRKLWFVFLSTARSKLCDLSVVITQVSGRTFGQLWYKKKSEKHV